VRKFALAVVIAANTSTGYDFILDIRRLAQKRMDFLDIQSSTEYDAVHAETL
jgi:hypothetical protein